MGVSVPWNVKNRELSAVRNEPGLVTLVVKVTELTAWVGLVIVPAVTKAVVGTKGVTVSNPSEVTKLASPASGRPPELQHVPTAMNRDSQDTPEVRV
jgi:hypothetical protein